MNARRFDFVSLAGFGGVYLFIACLYLSPADLIPEVAPLHPALLAAATMLAAMGLNRLFSGFPIRFAGGVGVAMGLLFAFSGMSALWAIDGSESVGFFLGAVKLMLAFVAIMSTLRSPRHIRTAIMIAVLACMVPGWGTIDRYRNGIGLVEGYRGTWIGLLANPNQVAMVMAVTVPWTVLMANRVRLIFKPILFVALGLEVGAIVATHSRGGSLGLAAAMVASASLADRKARSLGLVAIAAVAMLILAPKTFWARTSTIENYEQDASAMGRIMSWQTGLKAFEDSPLLGVGANNYTLSWDIYAHRNVREKAYASHNMWMQVLVELGLVGITLFGTMFALMLRGLWRARKHPEVGAEARALMASLIALVICGTTGGYAFNWFFYMVLGIAGAVITYARENPEQEGPVDGVELAVA